MSDRDQADQAMMAIALDEARAAAVAGDVPVGAVVVNANGQVVGRGRNQREGAADPLGHAELLAITAAARALGAWRLKGCTLYVTLEPCVMCAGAIIQARLERVVYGAADSRAGACGGLFDLFAQQGFNHYPQVQGGLLATECGQILKLFFEELRRKTKM